MAYLFVSYQSADVEIARALHRHLSQTLGINIFLSCDPEEGIPVGSKWPREVFERMQNAEAVVAVISPAWRKSRYCDDEYRLAHYMDKPLFALVLHPEEESVEAFLKMEIGRESYVSVDEAHTTEAFRALAHTVKTYMTAQQITPFSFGGTNPYKGLLSYEAQDAAVFFGRDVLRKKIVDGVGQMLHRGQKIYVLYGSSGTGKSSLMKAGVLPYLHYVDADKRAILPVFIPSGSSLHAFAGMLSEYLQCAREEVLEMIESGLKEDDGFRKFFAAIETRHFHLYGSLPEQILFCADQFELLFDAEKKEETSAFGLEHVLAKIMQHESVCMIVTLRSDFLYAFQHSALFGAFQEKSMIRFEVVHPIEPDKITALIKAPATLPELRGKLEIEDAFVEKIRSDLEGLDDVLPLLSLLLSNLFETHRGKLTAEIYQKGMLADLIHAMAEEEIAPWADNEALMEALKEAFIGHLVRIDMHRRAVKVKAKRKMLPSKALAPIDALVASRLLLGFSEENGREQMVEIAHEALLRHWKRLSEWVNEEEAFLKLMREVAQAHNVWQEADCKDEALLGGMALRKIEQDPLLEVRMQHSEYDAYVTKSLSLFRKRRKVRRGLLAGGFFAMTGLAVFGNVQYLRARDSEKKLQDEIVRTRHNIGRLFTQKAVYFLEQNRTGHARLYAAYALPFLQPEVEGSDDPIDSMTGVLRCFNDVPVAYVSQSSSDAYFRVTAKSNFSKVYVSTAYGGVFAASVKTGLRTPILSGKEKHDGKIYDICLSPDETMLYTASGDRTVKIIDLQNGGVKTLPPVQKGAVSSLVNAKNGKKLVCGSFDNTIVVWDVEKNIHVPFACACHDKPVRSLALSHDEKMLFSASYDTTIGVYDFQKRRFLYRLTGHTKKVNRVIVHPTRDDRIFSSSDDGTVREWEIGTNGGKLLRVFSRKGTCLYDIRVTKDGERLIASAKDNTITIWHLRFGIVESVMDAHRKAVSGVVVSPDSTTLVSVSWDGSMRYWDLAYFLHRPKIPKGHHGKVTGLAAAQSGMFVTGGADGYVKRWDIHTQNVTETFYGHTEAVYAIALFQGGTKAASASRDQTVRIWELADHLQPPVVLTHHKGRVYTLAIDASERYLASGSQDGFVYVYDLQQPNFPVVFSAKHASDIYHVCFIGERYIGTASDNAIYIWDMHCNNTAPLYVLSHNTKVYDMVYDAVGHVVYTCTKAGEIFQWKIDGAKGGLQKPLRMKLFEGHTKNVYALALSSDGKYLASASKDLTIKVWDTRTAVPQLTLKGHTDRIYHIAFTQNDKTLVSASWDATVRLWNIASPNMQAEAVLKEYPHCKMTSTDPLEIQCRNKTVLTQDQIDKTIRRLEKGYQQTLQGTVTVRKKIAYAKPEWSDWHPLGR